MVCNSCGKKITNNNETVCPYCNANLSEKEQEQQNTIDVDADIVFSEHSTKQDNSSNHVITPEVVGSENYSSSNFKGNSHSSYSRYVYTAQSGRSGHGVNALFFENGCFSALLTVVLAISCLIQFGVLSAIGFLVFSGIGSMLIFFLRIKNIMAHKMFNPWIARVMSWACAYMLTMWLSS